MNKNKILALTACLWILSLEFIIHAQASSAIKEARAIYKCIKKSKFQCIVSIKTFTKG